MVRRAIAALILVGLAGCWSTEPDYVAKQRPTLCDLRSQLVRRGFPENLDALFAGNCTVTRSEDMRGPDFTRWLGASSSAIMSCDAQFRIPFWTEKSPEGKITKVHFCPEFCMELRTRLEEEIKIDNELVCEKDAGVAGATSATAGTGSVFGIPLGGGSAGAAGAAAGGGALAGAGDLGGAAGLSGAGGQGGAAGLAGAGGM
jgi:hypothetical protein